MNKKLIRLTEQDLHRIVKESVKRKLRVIKRSNLSSHQPNSNLRPFTNKSNGLVEHMGESL